MMKSLMCVGTVAVTTVVCAKTALMPEPQSVVWDEDVRCPADAAVRETADASIPSEGYRLEVTKDGVTIASSDAAGAFYARQTLSQLEVKDGGKAFYQGCRISDRPAYPWRAVLLDEGRHFLGKETVMRTLDLMALYKLNRLHWHLTEDQGWRIDVPGMPELAKYGSVRAESPKHGSRLRHLGKFRYESDRNGQQYGPFFYTRADLEEVVAYAKERLIEIVPEIELPGHSLGAIAAFPELTCFPENITNRMAASDWGISTDVLCVGNDKTLRFLERVLDYVCEVFPSKVVHIGGDECPRLSWEKCPKCQARMKAEGLKKEGDLQAWITKKMAEYLAKKGRRIMGWDEILSGDVPMTAIGQSWRTQATNGAGTELVSGAGGAAKGFDMVMTPHTECYYSYGAKHEDDPFQYSSDRLPLSRAYAFDPMTGVPESARAHVLGSEACIWGEYTWNEYDLAWKLWPRAFAMAEILWRDPKPRDYRDFAARAAVHRKRLIAMGVNCAPVKPVEDDPVPEKVTKRIELLKDGDLAANWYTWTQRCQKRDCDPDKVFVAEGSTLKVSGADMGCVTTRKAYRDYRLTLEFRFVDTDVQLNKTAARDGGILFHSKGPDGSYGPGIWMASIEYNLIQGACGDLILVGDRKQCPGLYRCKGRVDPATCGKRCQRWAPDGVTIELVDTPRIRRPDVDLDWKNLKTQALSPNENPIGEWNKAEIVCNGDRLEFFFNGMKTGEYWDVQPTGGRIQLQSEGFGIEYRNIVLEPLP